MIERESAGERAVSGVVVGTVVVAGACADWVAIIVEVAVAISVLVVREVLVEIKDAIAIVVQPICVGLATAMLTLKFCEISLQCGNVSCNCL